MAGIAPREPDTAGRDLGEREKAIAQRVKEVTKRERELAKQAGRLAAREREFETRSAAAAQRREPKPVPEPAPAPAQPAATAAAPSAVGGWNINELQHAVDSQTEAAPDMQEQWRTYLFFLREHAAIDGSLPSQFDGLIDDVFGDLIRR
jgi:hypothetical protein